MSLARKIASLLGSGGDRIDSSLAPDTPPGAPAGAVIPYAGGTAPTGWLFCYGQAVSRTTYAALFVAIGTTFGTGDGSTTFNLPDMRGRIAAGKDNMGGTAAGRLTAAAAGVDGVSLGAVGGAQTHTLTEAQMPTHGHTGTTAGGGAHDHSVTGSFAKMGGGSSGFGTSGSWSGSAVDVAAAVDHTHTFTAANTGGGAAHPNVQPTLVLNHIIKT